MFNVTIYANKTLQFLDIEDIVAHTVPKAAIVDVRPVESEGNWTVYVDLTNGASLPIPLGYVQEQSQWTNDLTGANHCTSYINGWLNS